MRSQLFREGGPHNIRRSGPDTYSMNVTIPTDAQGLIARDCTAAACSPGSFKIKCGTGLKGPQFEAYCPYCRTAADPNDFATKEQLRYAKDVVTYEAMEGAQRMLNEALGIGRNGKRKIASGFIDIEMSVKSTPRRPVRRPWEEQLRRDVTCPRCALDHAVYGLAVWCPDCGTDIFMTHVETESQVLRSMLNDVERRNAELGPRVAARDIENGLEDVVSMFEAAAKAMVRRRLLQDGKTTEDVETVMTKQVRNRFQNFDAANDLLRRLFNIELIPALPADRIDLYKHTIEKRHPITHNLGIVDRKYLEKVRTGEAEGRDINLDEQEVLGALDIAVDLVHFMHKGMFR